MLDTLIEFDKSLLIFLNGLHNNVLDYIMWWFSEKYTWVPLYAAILGWWIKIYKWQTIWLIVFAVLLLTATDQISVDIKFATERLRPSHCPDIEHLLHHVKGYQGGQYGFVSSHAANTFGFAIFSLLMIRKRWYTYAILIWAAVVSYSRIYLGVHYPFDILGGALLGTALGFAAWWLARFPMKWLPFNQVIGGLSLRK